MSTARLSAADPGDDLELADQPSLPMTVVCEPIAVAPDAAAALLGLSPSFLAKLVASGRFPRPSKLGRRSLYSVSMLRKYASAGFPTADEWAAANGGDA